MFRPEWPIRTADTPALFGCCLPGRGRRCCRFWCGAIGQVVAQASEGFTGHTGYLETKLEGIADDLVQRSAWVISHGTHSRERC